MEPDDLKNVWQALDRRLAQQNRIQWNLLRETRLDKARASLRPLMWMQLVQMLLGLGLVLLGVACWKRNLDVPELFITGLLVHAFGVLHLACGGITIALIRTIDYDAPLLRIQKQMARLLRFQEWNSAACGLPWWIFWVLVLVAFAGLGHPPRGTQPVWWIWISLGVGVIGLVGTWWYGRRQLHASMQANTRDTRVSDGADGIRRSQRILDEIAAFEQE